MRTVFYALLSVLMIVLPSTVQAAQYYIHNLEGSVERLVGNDWKPAAKNEKLVLPDKFSLKEGAMLAIGDRDTHRVYITREAGVQNVAQIIQKARQQSSQTTRLALQKAIEASGDLNKPHVAIMGVGYRAGTSEAAMANDVNMKTYASICQFVKKPKASKTPQVQLTCVEEDGYEYFKVENLTDQLLYFNILAIPQGDGKSYLCLDTGDVASEDIPAVAPHADILLEQYPFIHEDVSCQYLLFASQEPFDAQMINSFIRQQSTPTKGAKPQPLYFYMLEK